MYNQYLEAFLQVEGHYPARDELVKKFAWAIPSNEAVELIAKYSPIVEMGAGTGYWAMMIEQAGGKVECFDLNPPLLGKNNYRHKRQCHKIGKGTPLKLRNDKFKDHTLFLCWPPCYDNTALHSIKHFKGHRLIYVGEGSGGCNANDEFFDMLDNEWEEQESLDIPQWNAIHDNLTIYKRLKKKNIIGV